MYNYMSKIKQLIDHNHSMAEAFLKVFEHTELNSSKSAIDEILGQYAAQELQTGYDYFFMDGSRLNIDFYSDCMAATKSTLKDIK